MTEQEMDEATKDLEFSGSPSVILATPQAILTKAIEKAIAGGWKPKEPFQWDFYGYVHPKKKRVRQLIYIAECRYSTEDEIWVGSDLVEIAPLILFDHDFAKALWGRKLLAAHNKSEGSLVKISDPMQADDDLLPAWAFHLQQMVIADDPIKYLGENI